MDSSFGYTSSGVRMKTFALPSSEKNNYLMLQVGHDYYLVITTHAPDGTSVASRLKLAYAEVLSLRRLSRRFYGANKFNEYLKLDAEGQAKINAQAASAARRLDSLYKRHAPG